VVSPASHHTQEHGAPCSPLLNKCYLHPEMPGKPVPLCKQKPQLLLLLYPLQKAQASRLGSPGSSTTELHSLKPMQEIRPQNSRCPQAWFSQLGNSTTELCSLKPIWEIRAQGSCYPKAWFPCACSTTTLPSWILFQENRTKNSICLKVWLPAAVAIAPGSTAPASKPQGPCFL
jgi:hypothetical protein